MSLFKVLVSFTALLCLYLFTLLLFNGQTFLEDLGIEVSESALFMSRRAAVLMLGISVLMLLIRNVTPSTARQAISLSLCTTMLGLAMMGSYEWSRGYVNNGIFTAITIELLVFSGFAWDWFKHRNIATTIA